jgi:DNA topoisomerase-1
MEIIRRGIKEIQASMSINELIKGEHVEVYTEDAMSEYFKALEERISQSNEEQSLEILEKARKDVSKLTKKVITDKRGKRKTVYVKTGEDRPVRPAKKGKQSEKKIKKEREPQWYDEAHAKHKISPLPVGVNPKDVEVYSGKDTDSHWVMRWKSPKTGKTVNAYSQAFHEKNAKMKWDRTKKLGGSKFIKDVLGKADTLMGNKDEKKAEAGAALKIIGHTGLRVGDESSYKLTGNEGVTTLTKKSISVSGDKVTLNFIGKSYKENYNVIKDKKLAEYLTKKMEGLGDNDRVFSVNRGEVMKSFRDDMGYKQAKVKDIRTVVAGEIASKILLTNDPPPPLPKNKTQAKKLVKSVLKDCFDKVSKQLNNTPSMAQKSYVNPEIIDLWTSKVGGADLFKSMDYIEDNKEGYLNKLMGDVSMSESSLKGSEDYMTDEDEDDESYPLPDWWNDVE